MPIDLVNLPGALVEVGKELAAVPEKNAGAMAKTTRDLMYRFAPHNRPRVYGSAILLRPVKQYEGHAATAVVGRGFAVLAEHGTWRHPHGFPIYPKAMTVNRKDRGIILKGAAGVNEYKSERAARAGMGRRQKYIAERNLHQVLAVGKNKGGGTVRFARYVRRHPPLRATPYVGRAVLAAQARSNELVTKNVVGIVAKPWGGGHR